MVEWAFDTRDAHAARKARIDFVKHVSCVFGAEADLTAAELILGELIGNVVRYAPGPAFVEAEFDERGVTIAVRDSGNGFSPEPPSHQIEWFTESGRGLAIVSTLADSLEIDSPGNAGCCVRARLELLRSN
jgi:anti-sigma regulatory factor (Ser/Thr protein kinase)